MSQATTKFHSVPVVMTRYRAVSDLEMKC